MAALGIEGITVSPGYAYAKRRRSKAFPQSRKNQNSIQADFCAGQGRQGVALLFQSKLFLDFLAGNRTYHCTPWGNPTRTVFGWQRPCYLLGEGYAATFKELMEETNWDCSYGTGNYENAPNCIVHCGVRGDPPWKMPSTILCGLLASPCAAFASSGPMAPDIPLDLQRPAQFVFSRQVEQKLVEIAEAEGSGNRPFGRGIGQRRPRVHQVLSAATAETWRGSRKIEPAIAPSAIEPFGFTATESGMRQLPVRRVAPRRETRQRAAHRRRRCGRQRGIRYRRRGAGFAMQGALFSAPATGASDPGDVAIVAPPSTSGKPPPTTPDRCNSVRRPRGQAERATALSPGEDRAPNRRNSKTDDPEAPFVRAASSWCETHDVAATRQGEYSRPGGNPRFRLKARNGDDWRAVYIPMRTGCGLPSFRLR